MARNYAALPYEYLEDMEFLTDEEFGALCRALIRYSRDGTPVPAEGNLKFFSSRVMRREDSLQESYNEAATRNRKNGVKGGRPKNPLEPTQTEKNPLEPTQTEKTEVKDEVKVKEEVKDNILPPNGESIPPISPKKSGKQQPKVQWAEFVTMTNGEYEKLLATYGPADTMRMIEILDNYKGSTGKKYSSDYRAILNWVVKRLQEEKAENSKNSNIFYEIGKERGVF